MVSKELASVEAISVKVSIKDIASLIGSVCESSYGVVGLTDVKDVRNTFATILNKENYVEGIFLRKVRSKYVVDVHVVIVSGVKISEVVNELSKRISYNLEQQYGKIFSKINIFVEELRVI